MASPGRGSEELSKKRLIVNLWLAGRELGVDIPNSEFASEAGCSYEYARRLTNELDDGAFDSEELSELKDSVAFGAFKRGLEAGTIEYREPTADAVEQLVADGDLSSSDASKRTRVLNIWLADTDIRYQDAAYLAGCSVEYARRLFNQIERGEISDEELSDHRSEPLQQALEQILEDYQTVTEYRRQTRDCVPVSELQRVREEIANRSEDATVPDEEYVSDVLAKLDSLIKAHSSRMQGDDEESERDAQR